MSMHTEVIYGYGFSIENIDEAALNRFVLNHKDSLMAFPYLTDEVKKEAISLAESGSGIWDDMCYLELTDGDGSALNLVVAILRQETGIGFETHIGENSEESAILLPETHVWLYNEAERAIESEEQMDGILHPYVVELGIPQYDVGQQRIEYFG